MCPIRFLIGHFWKPGIQGRQNFPGMAGVDLDLAPLEHAF